MNHISFEDGVFVSKKQISKTPGENITVFTLEKDGYRCYFTIAIKHFLHRKFLIVQDGFGLLDWLGKIETMESLVRFITKLIQSEETPDISVLTFIIKSQDLNVAFSSILRSLQYNHSLSHSPYDYIKLDFYSNATIYEKVTNPTALQTENEVLQIMKNFLNQAKRTYKMDFETQSTGFFNKTCYFHFYFLGTHQNKIDIQIQNNTWSLHLNTQKEVLPSLSEENISSTLEIMFQKEYEKKRLSYAINGDTYFFKKYFLHSRFNSLISYDTFFSHMKKIYGEKELEELSFQHLIQDNLALFTRNEQDHIMYGKIFDSYFMYSIHKNIFSMEKSTQECIHSFMKEQEKTHQKFFEQVEQRTE